MNMNKVVLSGLLAGCVGAGLMSGCKSTECCAANSYNKGVKMSFYKGGEFDKKAGKQAYLDLMKKFNVPVYSRMLQEDGFLWAVDFGKGDFEALGMGGVFWTNEPEGYLGHEIYLLPFQSIAEHRHLPTKDKDGNPIQAKMETWTVRHGYVYGFSEVGEPNLDTEFAFLKPKLSKQQYAVLKSKHVEKWTADGYSHKLPKVETWHFMMAGPEGAIVTETATFHDGDGLRFTVPGIKF